MPGESKQNSQNARTVYVVFAAAAHGDTGGRLGHQIVAIQQDREEAEQLEATYNGRDRSEDGVSARAFTQRYTVPYVAPAARDLTG
jgi:hypothetical protein